MTGTHTSRLAARLAGRHVLLTGVTGFLGQAVLERVLSELPDTRLSVLIRPGGGRTAQQRLDAVLAGPVTQALTGRLGSREALLSHARARVQVLAGDLDELPELPADLDAVVHCAGTVSFDPPIDDAFAVNVTGLLRLLSGVQAAAGTRRPHFLHVSTAYVSGARDGLVPETLAWPGTASADPATETDFAGSAAAACETDSRRPEVLARLRTQAAAEMAGRGPSAVAQRTEELRLQLVQRRRVDAGRERARSLGFTDCYTMTKALGEAALLAARGEIPVTVLRPSIIESALRDPHPGWIDGWKMAEPVILAYGRGVLPEFPAAPDGVIDIVPVDLVVSVLLAALADPPPAQRPACLQVTSGSRNPLLFAGLYEAVREYFSQFPLPQRTGGAARGGIAVPEWTFPGPETVRTRLRIAERAVAAADRLVAALPSGEPARRAVTALDRRAGSLSFLRRYSDLYEPYTAATVVFDDHEVRDLVARQHPEDRARWVFDPCEIDWPSYLIDVHCPAVTAGLRTPRAARPAPALAALPPDPAGSSAADATVVAAFDLDGTLVASTVVESYLWLRLAGRERSARVRELAGIARRLPGYLRADATDRAGLLRAVYRRYAGVPFAELEDAMAEQVGDLLLERASAAALRRLREHRAAGHRTVLLTGALEVLTRPLAPLFDDIVAARLAVGPDGRCTGRLAEAPVVGEARGRWLASLGATGRTPGGAVVPGGVDLAESAAYADSISDLPMLLAVGKPAVVRPDVALLREARRRHWPILEWAPAAGSSRLRLPAAAAPGTQASR